MEESILDEIDRFREEEAARFNYDIRALCAYYKDLQAKSGRTYVSLPPQRIEAPSAQNEDSQ